uniref:Uncharacterized protein n=1 Tax=Rhizophora mucronata TaxID=61149 RepID=A0A2P2QG00_RHIMU
MNPSMRSMSVISHLCVFVVVPSHT